MSQKWCISVPVFNLKYITYLSAIKANKMLQTQAARIQNVIILRIFMSKKKSFWEFCSACILYKNTASFCRQLTRYIVHCTAQTRLILCRMREISEDEKSYLRRGEINQLFLFVFVGTKVRIQTHANNSNEDSNNVPSSERIM